MCLRLIATLLLAGLLGAVLVRMAPGFGVDEREIDPRLSGESQLALRQAHEPERNVAGFYAAYLRGLVRGDLGVSHSLRRPVVNLIAERLPVTCRSAAIGLICGWLAGLGLALAGRRCDFIGALAAGALLCLPSAVLALVVLYAELVPGVAIAAVLFPRIYRYARNLLRASATLPHVLMARAKGTGALRTLFRHTLPPAAPQMLALAGVSVNLAFGAAIPVEVVCDSPGVGQLAWQAALSRDLPLLLNVTLLVTLLTLAANSLSDLAAAAARRPA
jgi:peptide/nickel transport system permease protein